MFGLDPKLKGQLVTSIQIASDDAIAQHDTGTDLQTAWDKRYRWFCPNLKYEYDLMVSAHKNVPDW